jgi:hypothetical protein
MTLPKLSLIATETAIEGGANGIFTINLDTPAPAGGLLVSYNETGDANHRKDYTLTAGDNITALTKGSFVIEAGATTAILGIAASMDTFEEGNEGMALTLNLKSGGDYEPPHIIVMGCIGLPYSASPFYDHVPGLGSLTKVVAVGLWNYDGYGAISFFDASGGITANRLDNVPTLLGLADVNGDNKLDIVTNNNFKVSGQNPVSMSLGDVNGDNKLDIVTANADSNNMSLLLGDGAGNFIERNTFKVGDNPQSIKLGDINGDGYIDVVTANKDSNNISVLFGNGKGSFSIQQTFTVGNNPSSVALNDFNGDGNLDVIIANAGDNNLSLLSGDGKGNFAKQQLFTVGANPLSMTLGDVNGDGNLDVVTANADDDNVSLLVSDGKGNFSSQKTFKVGDYPWSIAFGDINEDGRLDVITANRDSSNIVGLLNTGKTNGTTEQTVSAKLNIIDNHRPTGNVELSDSTPEVGKTISVSNNLKDADGIGTVSYSWSYDHYYTEHIVGVGNSYTPKLNDLGYQLIVTASYIDGLGVKESINSISTSAVTVSNLMLNGTESDDVLNGGMGNDKLYGNAGSDTLNGSDGKDRLIGGIGDDTLNGGAGNDILAGTADNDLEKGEDGNDALWGIGGDNTLEGGAGNDRLVVGRGHNLLSGGDGKDVFRFSSASHSTITDFVVADDTIKLQNKFFTKLTSTGTLDAANFVISTTAVDSDDYLVYNPNDGKLYYDADGSGSGSAIQIAVLGVNLNLTNADFVVI